MYVTFGVLLVAFLFYLDHLNNFKLKKKYIYILLILDTLWAKNMKPTAKQQPSVFARVASALFYGISSFLITVVNKTVLTSFDFPSYQFLGIGQMLTTIIVLFICKKLNYVNFPNLQADTLTKIWPLPIIFIGNMVFGLGGTKQISLPMFTALRRFSILMTMIAEYYILGVKAGKLVQVLLPFRASSMFSVQKKIQISNCRTPTTHVFLINFTFFQNF